MPRRLDDLRREDDPDAEARRPLMDDDEEPSLLETIFFLPLPRDLLLLVAAGADLSVLLALRAREDPARLSVEPLVRKL